MNIGKFVLNVVVAYILYAALYIVTMMVIFGDVYAANAGLMRAEDDPMMPYAYVGHLLQTIIVVILFNKAVGSGDIKAGATFGALIGGYLAATDIATYASMTFSMAPLGHSIVLHILIGAIVGSVLAFMWGKGWGSGANEAAASDS